MGKYLLMIGALFLLLSGCAMVDNDNDVEGDDRSPVVSLAEQYAPLAFRTLIDEVGVPIYINNVTYICYLYDTPYEKYEACAFYTVYRLASGSSNRYAEVWVEELPSRLYAYVYDLEDQAALTREYEFLRNEVRFDSDYEHNIGFFTRGKIDEALRNMPS